MEERLWAYGCSPYAAPTPEGIAQHVDIARQLARAIWEDGYWPVLPHLYAPLWLDDTVPAEREAGLQWGLDLLMRCRIFYVYAGGEPSRGMQAELQVATDRGIPIRAWVPDSNASRVSS